MTSLVQTTKTFNQHFTKAIQAEVWEDVEQAEVHYTSFIREYKIECLQIKTRQELERCVKALVLVELRRNGLQTLDFGSGRVEVKDLKRLRPYLTQPNGFSTLLQDNVVFPPSLFVGQEDTVKTLYGELCSGVTAEDIVRAQLEAGLKALRGLTLRIERIGEKKVALVGESVHYERPFVRVHLYDHHGRHAVEPFQDTKGGARDQNIAQHILFMQDLRFDTDIEVCKTNQYVVYLEFMYRNKRKGCDETKCWACLEMDEIPEGGGPLLLEWYSVPMDTTRTNLKLHTVKELYCNIVVVNDH